MLRLAHSFVILISLSILAVPAFSYQQIEFIKEIGEYGRPAGQRLMNGPRGIAVAHDRLYIADTDANRILVLDRNGKTIQSWGSKGDRNGQFRTPSGVAVDEDGMVYVADSGNGRIQVFTQDGAFIRSIGGKGSGPKQFSNPSGIDVSNGILYVADTDNERVQILTVDGIYLGEITFRTKTDVMEGPIDVAVDRQNRIYVLDSEAGRVRIFDASGGLINSFGTKGKGTDGFNEPSGIAVDIYGQIFVSDTENFKLKKFDFQGRLLGSLGTEGDGPGQFREPCGIDVDAESNVYVLDSTKNTLQIFACEKGSAVPLSKASPPASVGLLKEIPLPPGGISGITFEKRAWGIVKDALVAVGVIDGRKIGQTGTEPGRLRKPHGIAVDGRGNFWVADTGNDRLQKFSLEGNLLQVIGKSGRGEGEFKSPWAVAISPKGNICVADTGNRRIQVFSQKGMFLGAFGKSGRLAGQLWEPVDLAVDAHENIYVVDRGNDRIAKYDGTGVLLWEVGKTGSGPGQFDKPESIIVSADNEIYVLDSGNSRIQVFDATTGKYLRKFGSGGKGPGEFRSPRGMALEEGIRLYVGDSGNNRVQVFSLRHTPSVPQGVAAQGRVNEIHLSWRPNQETYIEQYRIYRAESPGDEFRLIATSTEPFYIDRNLPSNRAFHYRISSKASSGNESALSETVSAVTPRLVPSPPKKPEIQATEKQITLAWLPNTEPFVSHYNIYRTRQLSSGFELLQKSDKTVFVDGPLADETLYYYQVTAVGKEGDESQPSEVVFATTPKASLTVPPLEIAKVEMGEIFASAYKHYEAKPLGRVTLRNNTDSIYLKVKLGFTIKNIMDYPTEIEIDQIPPKQEMVFDIKPVFSNRILDITENTSVQSEISLTYHVAGEPRTVARSFPITLYERHAMTWDRKEKAAAFVTPRDPMVADFSRSVVQQYVDAYPNLHPNIVYGRALFAALGVYGLSYIVDPTSPYQEFSENTARVDYLQYPRDTINRKSGDCDDLSVLFAAALENIGIAAALVDVPGHVFVIFNTGVTEAERNTLGFPDERLVVHRGFVWIPVEMTLIGSSFTKAWQKGAERYRDWSAKKGIEIIEIQKAWEEFKPATLPGGEGRSIRVTRQEIEAKFKGELESLGRQRLSYLSAEYLEALKKKPDDIHALGQLGILYGENGLYTEALEQFQKMLAIDKTNPIALNNIGNISLLQERLDDARQAYESALKSSPDDPGIMCNLARVFMLMGKKEEAKRLFLQAAEIDPRVFRQYIDLTAGLGIGK